MDEGFLDRFERYHLIGIGGISMSALAKLLISCGKKVSGSDLSDSALLAELRALGAEIHIGHSAEYLADAQCVVFTSAVKPEHPELSEAVRTGLCVVERHKLLGAVSARYRRVIAVAGTHGKTTTTAMLGEVFCACGVDPTVHLGGKDRALGGNLRIGKSECFLTEACEYRRSFLSLKPYIGIILNADWDHPDCYASQSDVIDGFQRYADRCDKLIINADCEACSVLKHPDCVTFGIFRQADFCAVIKADRCEGSEFDVYAYGKKLFTAESGVCGIHNVYNALAAVATAAVCGLSSEGIVRGLRGFRGVERRFERLGAYGHFTVISDYAHHPQELKALLSMTRVLSHRFLCVFQPHTYSRTQALMSSFAESFCGAEAVAILPVYAAREERVPNLEESLTALIAGYGTPTVYCQSEGELCDWLEGFPDADVLLMIGAGDIDGLARKLVVEGKERSDRELH